MKQHLSQRAQELPGSPTLELANLVNELKASGRDILSFALGEPDFETPPRARDRAKAAIDEGHTHYTGNAGISPLRNAARQHFARSLGLDYAEEQILISPGAKFSLHLALQTILDPGDEVLVPTPVWVSTCPQLSLCGATPVRVPAREQSGFIPSPADLAQACTDRTRLIVLCSPNNPTGAVYSRQVLEEIADLALERDLLVLSDEIYQSLVYGEHRHVSIASVRPDMVERTMVVWGMSKSYAMTGWRIGVAAGPHDWIKACARLQSHTTSCASSVSQYASLGAILGCDEDVEAMREEFNRRRLYMVGRLRRMPGVTCTEPHGTFYVFPGITGCLGRSLEGRVL